jgi:hypothetical protein
VSIFRKNPIQGEKCLLQRTIEKTLFKAACIRIALFQAAGMTRGTPPD